MSAYDNNKRLVVAFGGGVNSTAMLVEMHRRRIKPDLILFADTGGERPETYSAVVAVSDWLESHGIPRVVTVSEPSRSLEDDCLNRNQLPAIAYGFKSCSERWKIRPCQRYLKKWINSGETVINAVGFDAGEERRVKNSDDPRWVNWFPLIEWGIYRDDCESICLSEGLPIGKSSCFFCPNMKKHEIFELKKKHPALLERALTMERNAELTTVKGLGRDFAWGDLIATDNAQLKLFPDNGAQEIPCGCYDG